jgi:isocitrate dehydrogenase (NAD+)
MTVMMMKTISFNLSPKLVSRPLFQSLQLYANVRPCVSIPGYKTRYDNVNLVTIRENTEGEYSGVEGEWAPSEMAFSMKIITKNASERVAKYAFDYAVANGRSKVTTIHKANIMKKADGLFLKTAREVSELYPHIKHEEMIVDNACMQLVAKPEQVRASSLRGDNTTPSTHHHLPCSDIF